MELTFSATVQSQTVLITIADWTVVIDIVMVIVIVTLSG